MSRKFQASFSGGELDPSLNERVDLDKYKSALATARNVLVAKTGRIISRPGRKFLREVYEYAEDKFKIFLAGLNNGVFTEWGRTDPAIHSSHSSYVRAQTYADAPPSMFTPFSFGSPPVRRDMTNLSVVITGPTSFLGVQFLEESFYTPNLNSISVNSSSAVFNTSGLFVDLGVGSAGTGAGYDVQYMATAIRPDGLEEFYGSWASPSGLKLPIAANQSNLVNYEIEDSTGVEQINVYRRPKDSGAFGFIGTVSTYILSGTKRVFSFTDHGQNADYAQTPPMLIGGQSDISSVNSLKLKGCATMHQSRLLLGFGNRIYTSVIGHTRDALRYFPYTHDSALISVVGEQGLTRILWMVSQDGLVVFTTTGIYSNRGPYTFENSILENRGEWVCDEYVPPIKLPGGILFVDASTNTVRELHWDDNRVGYLATEVSIFSDHLFSDRKITSWAFQGGEVPLLYVTFSDGKSACFTYEPEHQMRAWTRVDSFDNIEFVASLNIPSDNTGSVPRTDILFVVRNANGRHIEVSVPRYPSVRDIADNPEHDKGQSAAAMDSMVSWSNMLLNLYSDASQTTTVSPVTPGDWEDQLDIASTDDIFAGISQGTFLKWFHPKLRYEIVLEVVTKTDDYNIVVEPSEEFPSEYASEPRLYECKTTFTGLNHLEGMSVSIMADGYVIASPNNNIENYPNKIVTGGSVTLDDPYAIVHIGLPYVMDVETLDITETGQGRALEYARLESVNVNKVFITTNNTRGLYVGNRFPDDDKLLGNDVTGTNMVRLDGFDSYDVNYEEENPIIGNRYDQPSSKRIEMNIPGDWNTRGRICLRNVDPVHFEILAINPDVEIQEV